MGGWTGWEGTGEGELASSARVTEGHEAGAYCQGGLFYPAERDMAGVVWWWAGEAGEGDVPFLGGGCESCCGGPEPVVARCESRGTSKGYLHVELGPEHQNCIVMSGRAGVVRSWC